MASGDDSWKQGGVGEIDQGGCGLADGFGLELQEDRVKGGMKTNQCV